MRSRPSHSSGVRSALLPQRVAPALWVPVNTTAQRSCQRRRARRVRGLPRAGLPAPAPRLPSARLTVRPAQQDQADGGLLSGGAREASLLACLEQDRARHGRPQANADPRRIRQARVLPLLYGRLRRMLARRLSSGQRGEPTGQANGSLGVTRGVAVQTRLHCDLCKRWLSTGSRSTWLGSSR